jgi:tRNA-modifying protein YgfZ
MQRDVVSVVGADARSYLQGQLSQDMAEVDREGSAWSWLLQPDGKVTALLRVVRESDEHFNLEVDIGYGEAVVARLKRFLLRVKVELSLSTVEVDDAEPTRTRIERRWPAMGTELDESTIPNAAGINDRTVSFKKGCYTGQELVARVDSRGNNTPTSLHLVRASTGQLVVGSTASVDGKVVATVTSADADIALAWVARSVEPGTELILDNGATVLVE